MNNEKLFLGFSYVSDELLEKTEKTSVRKKALKHWVSAAACFCIVLSLGVFFFNSNNIHGTEVNDGNSGDVISDGNITDSGDTPPNTGAPLDPYNNAIVYNSVSEVLQSDTALKNGVYLFGEKLTSEELKTLIPSSINEWAKVSGEAIYTGYRELYYVLLNISSKDAVAEYDLRISNADSAIHYDCIVQGDNITVSQIDGLDVTAYEYDSSVGTKHLWADFIYDGIRYSIYTECKIGDLSYTKGYITDIVRSYASEMVKSDLSLFKPKTNPVFKDEVLTLSQAFEDKDYGRFFPKNIPEGFQEENIRRHTDPHSDYLSGMWTKGYSYLNWRVSKLDDFAESRLTSVDDTQNYDLSLYPIPMADSVPDDLREIVNDPVFKIEELTLDTVYKRARIINDIGDTNGYRLMFSILYNDTVVSISTKGVSPEWVFEALKSIK